MLLGNSCHGTHLLAVEGLVEDDPNGPDVHFGADLRWVFPQHKALRREVPADKHHHGDMMGG